VIPPARVSIVSPEDLIADEIFCSQLSKPYPVAARAFRQVTSGESLADLSDFDRTDAAIARSFALAERNDWKFDWRLATWRHFESPVWRLDQVGGALLQLQEHVEQKLIEATTTAKTKADREALRFFLKQLDARRLKGTLQLAASQPDLRMHGDEFDRHTLLFTVANGVIDLQRGGTFRAGRPDDYLSRQSLVRYDPTATCPRFMQFLPEVFDDDAVVAFIKRWCGYCLTALTNEQVFLCWWGAGANGKGVLLGEYGLTLPFASFTSAASNGASATPDLARLPSRRLAVASETRSTSKFDAARLKALTGEDMIAARPLYGSLFEFRPVAKLLFLFNDRPRVTDLSHAFWRRALLVPFSRQFSERDRDPHLRETLRAEASGILNWAIEGCREWQRIGLQPPAAVRSAVESWREESDLVAEFLGTGCHRAPGTWVHARDLFAAFQRWCDLEGVSPRDRIGRNAFTGRLGKLAESSRRSNGTGFIDVRPRAEVSQ
jgi:putative DNA primase/helicase